MELVFAKIKNIVSEYNQVIPQSQTADNPVARLWLKAVTEPNSARHTATAEWIRPESTENDGSVRFSNTGI